MSHSSITNFDGRKKHIKSQVYYDDRIRYGKTIKKFETLNFLLIISHINLSNNETNLDIYYPKTTTALESFRS